MKRAYLLAALAPILLSSCAGPAITQLDADIANANAAKTVACYNAQMQAAWKPDAFADAKDQALIIMAQALASMGRPDPCAAIAGMSVYEARARIAESQNKAAAGITGNVLTGAIAVTGIIAGADVLKSALDSAGTKTTVTGDNNSLTRTSTDTTSTSTTSQTVSGAGSGATSTSPGTTGPDQSTSLSLGDSASATLGQ